MEIFNIIYIVVFIKKKKKLFIYLFDLLYYFNY